MKEFFPFTRRPYPLEGKICTEPYESGDVPRSAEAVRDGEPLCSD